MSLICNQISSNETFWLRHLNISHSGMDLSVFKYICYSRSWFGVTMIITHALRVYNNILHIIAAFWRNKLYGVLLQCCLWRHIYDCNKCINSIQLWHMWYHVCFLNMPSIFNKGERLGQIYMDVYIMDVDFQMMFYKKASRFY